MRSDRDECNLADLKAGGEIRVLSTAEALLVCLCMEIVLPRAGRCDVKGLGIGE